MEVWVIIIVTTIFYHHIFIIVSIQATFSKIVSKELERCSLETTIQNLKIKHKYLDGFHSGGKKKPITE